MTTISRCNGVAHAWLTYWHTWLSCSLENNIITSCSFKKVTELQSARPGADDNVVMINSWWWARCRHHQQQQPWCCILRQQHHRCRFVRLPETIHTQYTLTGKGKIHDTFVMVRSLFVPGTFASWNIRSPERIGPGTCVTWNFRSQEYSSSRNIRSLKLPL